MNLEPQRGPYVGILPSNDAVISIWASIMLRDCRNRLFVCHILISYITDLRNSTLEVGI